MEKFSKLTHSNTPPAIQATVKNISDRNLDHHETSVLSKGLNFALNHTNKDVLQFIA